MPKTVRVRIEGSVQGVGFRAWTVRSARQLGLNGWVRNRQDGSVEALLHGEETAVDEMVRRCRDGPTFASVTVVEAKSAVAPTNLGFQELPTS